MPRPGRAREHRVAFLDLRSSASLNTLLCVSTVLEIESAIRELPEGDFWKLAHWFDDLKDTAWSEQMQSDSASGRLDFLFEEAAAARASGQTKPWPAQA